MSCVSGPKRGLQKSSLLGLVLINVPNHWAEAEQGGRGGGYIYSLEDQLGRGGGSPRSVCFRVGHSSHGRDVLLDTPPLTVLPRPEQQDHVGPAGVLPRPVSPSAPPQCRLLPRPLALSRFQGCGEGLALGTVMLLP